MPGTCIFRMFKYCVFFIIYKGFNASQMVIIDTETTKFAGMTGTLLIIDDFHQNPCKCCFRCWEFEKFSSFKSFHSLMVANVSFLSHGFVRCKPGGTIEIVFLVLCDNWLSHDVAGDIADLPPKKDPKQGHSEVNPVRDSSVSYSRRGQLQQSSFE